MILGIYGSSGLGKEILETAKMLAQKKGWDTIVFINDFEPGCKVHGIELVSYQTYLQKYSHKNSEVIIGVGEPRNREILYKKCRNDSLSFATIIFPTVHIPESSFIGEGVYIGQNCLVSCDVRIEENVLLSPNALVSHDSSVGQSSFLASNSVIAGYCKIGRRSFIGIGTCIREDLSIGDDTIIGMGSCVVKNIPSGVIAVGCPARVVKTNDKHTVFNR